MAVSRLSRNTRTAFAWWVSEPDKGQADAINKGLAHARGEIAAWLNSDDYYLPGAVSSAVRAFEAHPEAVLIYGNVQSVDEMGMSSLAGLRSARSRDLLCFQILGQPAAFMRRRAVESAEGSTSTTTYCLITTYGYGWRGWVRSCMWIRRGQPPLPRRRKNRALAGRFGEEAFKLLDWAAGEQDLAPVLRGSCLVLGVGPSGQRPLHGGRRSAVAGPKRMGCAHSQFIPVRRLPV